MEEDFHSNLPIYLQIVDRIKNLIVSSKWEPGFRVPSVRELARQFSVSPNTMQRALSELEREELLYSERTAGRFVTQNRSRISAVRDEMTDQFAFGFVNKLLKMGYSGDEVRGRVQQALKRRTAEEPHY